MSDMLHTACHVRVLEERPGPDSPAAAWAILPMPLGP
jgi:hypothetical protein